MALTGDPALGKIRDEVTSHPSVKALLDAKVAAVWDEPPLLVPLRLQAGARELSLFTTLTTFGTPRDVTLDELAVELFFPADDATATILRSAQAQDGVSGASGSPSNPTE